MRGGLYRRKRRVGSVSVGGGRGGRSTFAAASRAFRVALERVVSEGDSDRADASEEVRSGVERHSIRAWGS